MWQNSGREAVCYWQQKDLVVLRELTVKFSGIKGKIVHVANNPHNYNPRAPKVAPALPFAGPPSSLASTPWTSHSPGLCPSGLHLWVSLQFVSNPLASILLASHSPKYQLAGPPTSVGPPTLRSPQSLSPNNTFSAPSFFGPLHSFELPDFGGFPHFWGLFTSLVFHSLYWPQHSFHWPPTPF